MYFNIYDSNFNKIPLPKDDTNHGLTGLDLFVSSISQDLTEHTTPRNPGNTTTGVRDNDRDVSISVFLSAMNSTDYRMKRDRVYAFFRSLGSFYVAETQQGNKLLKVRVVDSYIPERLNQKVATIDIPLKIEGHPYWVSRFKTMDLHNNKGIPVNSNWSFGMGIDVSPDNLKYQHENVSEFNIFNAGIPLKTIQEKDNCEIKIEIKQNVTSFMLYDATGSKWEYNSQKKEEWKLKNGDEIIFNGHDVRLNKTTIMERTNRYYPIIESGMNRFRTTGLTNYKISFDFRFKYY